MAISDSVGSHAKNDPADVKIVQVLLNANAERFAGGKQLVVDGYYGSRTAAAVRAFQATIVGTVEPQIAPRDPTIVCLVEGLQPELGMPHVQAIMAQTPYERVEPYAEPLVSAMRRCAIDSRLRQVHFLAQVGHESTGLRSSEDLANGDADEGRADLGNNQPGDGPRFKGRGLLRLRGRDAYARHGAAIGIDLVKSNLRDTLASDPARAAHVACWIWQERGLNELADRDDLEGVTRTLTGGLQGLDGRLAYLRRAKYLL